MKSGLQNYVVEETDDEWVLYHNSFSLCSRKVRMCLAECDIRYRSEHIDLIETGAYEVASPRFLGINPGGTVPVLLHRGKPVYESHEQIHYAAKHSDSIANSLIPTSTDDAERMNFWVEKSSLVGDPLVNQDKYAGNSVAPLTFPLFATTIQYIPTMTILRGLPTHPIKVRVLFFLILKVFGLGVFRPFSPITKMVRLAYSSVEKHLSDLDDHLLASDSTWIAGEEFSLADVSWAVLLHRLEETGWIEPLCENKMSLKKYIQRIKQRDSFQVAIMAFAHPIVSKGGKGLQQAIKGSTCLAKLHADLRG